MPARGRDRAVSADIKKPMDPRHHRRRSAVRPFHGLALLAATLVILALILGK
jgi:hypothetical protein